MERHLSEYFNDWLRAAQEDMARRRSKEESTQAFAGFGRSGENDPEAWAQWFAHVQWVNDGSRENDEDDG